MTTRRSSRRITHTPHKPISWLPIDSRLISFSQVRGVARVFILIEMILSVGVVVGSLVLVVMAMMP